MIPYGEGERARVSEEYQKSIRKISEEYYQIIANSSILVFCTYYVAVHARPHMRGTFHTKGFPPFTGVGLWLPNHSSLIINLASPAFLLFPRPKSGLNLEKCASFTVATPPSICMVRLQRLALRFLLEGAIGILNGLASTKCLQVIPHAIMTTRMDSESQYQPLVSGGCKFILANLKSSCP